jgi:RNase H-fold protein (predicted Holliday junction resolvase)
VPRLSCQAVETISRPLRIPREVYEVAKEANDLEAALRPVNSILVEAIVCGLPLVIGRIDARNRELRECLRNIAAAAKLPATIQPSRGKCGRGKQKPLE